MRISDWSSDVCSSDLEKAIGYQYYTTLMAWRSDAKPVETWQQFWDVEAFPGKRALPNYPTYALPVALLADGVKPEDRSEERRVGKGCVSTWRSRWSTYHQKKKKNIDE